MMMEAAASDPLVALSISTLEVDKCDAAALAFALRELPALTSLDLWGNLLGLHGLRVVSPDLAGLTALRSLDLSRNNAGTDGNVRALARALRCLTALASLKLNDNHLYKRESFETLASAFVEMKALAALELAHSSFAAAVPLINVLAGLPALTSLNLSGTIDPYTRAADFAGLASLTSLSSLTSLDMSSNYLGAVGVDALAPALRSMTALKCLSLESCNLFGKAKAKKDAAALASALVAALRGSTALERLNLCLTELDADGVAALAAALQGMPALSWTHKCPRWPHWMV